MQQPQDIVITGVGVVSPIGIGCEPFWDSLAAGVSGIRPIDLFDSSSLRVRFGGQIPDFDPKLFVRPRKSLKVMSREIQMGFAAADLAMGDAGLTAGQVDPERFGVVFGGDMIYADLEDLERTYRRAAVDGRFSFPAWAEAIHEELHPLWLLKHLPNMAASHVAIAHDARGPNNSIVLGDVSGLLAIAEAASVIRRGWADVMLVGGTGCRLHPTALVARGDALLSHRADDCRRAARPFDRDRDGLVNGEGAGALLLESRAHAQRRDGRIRGRLLAAAARCEPTARRHGVTGSSLRAAIRAACAAAGLVPVTAPKSAFGHLGAAGGVVELAASVLGLERGLVPATLNYETPDPTCPVNVVAGGPLAGRPGTAVAVNLCSTGQAAAVAIAAD